MAALRFLAVFLITVFSYSALARVGSSTTGNRGGLSGMGGWGAVGLYGGIVNTSQGDLNMLQQRANTASSISTGQLNQAYELAAFYQYRISGTMYAFHVRPSYFYERQDGSGAAGAYTYGVTGWTVFPMLRMYPLESDFMKMYIQFGLGYGSANGMITEGQGNDVKFSGSAFGTNIGLGAEFCLTNEHCFALEGNYRYMSMDRNIVSSSNGSFAANSLSQYGKGQELELDGNDLSVKMGGLMFLAGYMFYF
jgi:hypothetical protein